MTLNSGNEYTQLTNELSEPNTSEIFDALDSITNFYTKAKREELHGTITIGTRVFDVEQIAALNGFVEKLDQPTENWLVIEAGS